MKKLCLLLFFLVIAPCLYGQATRQTCTLAASATCNMGNANGAYGATFEEIPNGSPSGVSVTVQGCMTGGTCDTAVDTNTSTSAAIRGVTFTKPYDYFKITAGTLTGGTSPTMTVNSVISAANAHGAGSGFTTAAQVVAAFTGCSGTQYLGADSACHSTTALSGTGLVRQTGVGTELSGDATTSGSNAVTVVRLNGTSLAGLATGILKNTTTTGVPSIAVGSDLPTAIPIAKVGSAGLSATGPVEIASTGVIDILGSGTVASAQGGTGVSNTATLTLGTTNHNYATLGTGIIKNTTTTGALSVAVGSDLPAAIPIASVGSAGLSATGPIEIASTGVIDILGTGTVAPAQGGSGVSNTATHTLGTSNQNWATLGTGIVKNTTTTGALSVAVGSDLPAAIPIASVGSAGLSATGPVRIASTGVIDILGSGTVAAAQGGTGVSNTATLTLGSSNQNWATLGTGIVKNTTTTGALSVAVGSDLPTGIPIGSVGSSGLSGTSPVTISAAGAIACATCGVLVASGTSALGTGAITSGTCATVVTTTATGAASTSNVMADFNADPTGVTGYAPSANGMLTIIKYPTTNNVNFKVCNNTSASITPGAITLNWKVF